jgi:HicB family
MDLTPFVDAVRRELAVAAEAGGEDARALAERLTAPLDSALRLTLLDALSAAADEITRDLAPGSVDVRLRGREPDFVVTLPPFDGEPGDVPARAEPPPVADDGATSRINLRLPDQLKARAEEAAAREGLSLNAWLVRAAAAALPSTGRDSRPGRPPSGRHYTGWVR